MVKEVHSRRQNGVAVLILDRPVANALAPTLRYELMAAVNSAIADNEIHAIVLTGAGNVFSPGVDIAEFDRPLEVPWVDQLCTLIEECKKPVVVAMQGSAFGAGFELALAAHGRVVRNGTRVALPEIGFGLVPGGGATQRLPRLVGAQAALELLLSGQAVDVSDPRLKHVFDQRTDENPLAEAIVLARAMAESQNWLKTKDRLIGFSDPDRYQKAIAMVKPKLPPGASAELDVVKCVEAAQLLPFDSGLAFEKAIFEERIHLPEVQGQRHCFVAERRAAIMPELRTGKAADIYQVAFLGADLQDAELVVSILDAGKRLCLVNTDKDKAEAVRAGVEAIYDGAVSRKRIDPEIRSKHLASLSTAQGSAYHDNAQLIVDAGREGTIDLPASARDATRIMLDHDGDLPSGAVGCRIYRPVSRRRVAEIAVAPDATANTVATVDKVLSRMGLTVVRTKPVSGGVGGALMMAVYCAALRLVQAGLAPIDVDRAVKRLGFALGAFQMIDIEGLPSVRDRMNQFLMTRGQPALGADNVLNRLIHKGAAGRSVGRGFYVYQKDGIHPIRGLAGNDPEMSKAVRAVQPDQAIHAAIVNEAAHLLTNNTVQRASDLDVLIVRGYGFNRTHGGPLFYADLQGVYTVLKNLNLLQPFSESIWAPHPLIEEMVKNGDGFFGRAG